MVAQEDLSSAESQGHQIVAAAALHPVPPIGTFQGLKTELPSPPDTTSGTHSHLRDRHEICTLADTLEDLLQLGAEQVAVCGENGGLLVGWSQ